jgi:hypothetical protein
MKIKHLRHFGPALLAMGVFLGRGAYADTILDFNTLPRGVRNNDNVAQTFGDAVSASSDGITVVGFGTPNLGLTWQSSAGAAWQWYVEDLGAGGIWAAVQLDNSTVGARHELVFAPNNSAAAAVIKSLNFHGYYISNERFTYDVSILAGTTLLSEPTNITFLSDATKSHPVSMNYTGSIGQTLTLRLTRVASSLGVDEVEGNEYDIAVDDITFGQLPETALPVWPMVLSITPANNDLTPPDRSYVATIVDGDTALKTTSVGLTLNGSSVTPTVSKVGTVTTVSYQGAGLLAPSSTNVYRLTYTDNKTPPPANSFTNDVQFMIVDYVNKQLPAPIVLETFDTTAEGSLPAGWTATSLDTQRDGTSEPSINFTNLDSAAYTNWTVVNVFRFTNTFDVYSTYYNGGTPDVAWTEDYRRVLSLNPSNVVNGAFLRNLATNRMAFGNTGYRLDALGQILYLFSPDFNLTGRTNVYLSFHSLWEQNQDSMGAVEYSIDLGATWLPALYLLDGPDIFTNLDGSIDSLTTFTNVVIGGFEGIAEWLDGGLLYGGYYGAFIGVASNRWGTLGPSISARVDNDPTGSKRVEIIRLPQADNQPNVRLRFAHAGTDSWYWGIDDVGLYSLPTLRITNIVRGGDNVIISWPGELNTKLQKAASLTSPSWQDVAGSTGASSATNAVSGAPAYYRLARPY